MKALLQKNAKTIIYGAITIVLFVLIIALVPKKEETPITIKERQIDEIQNQILTKNVQSAKLLKEQVSARYDRDTKKTAYDEAEENLKQLVDATIQADSEAKALREQVYSLLTGTGAN